MIPQRYIVAWGLFFALCSILLFTDAIEPDRLIKRFPPKPVALSKQTVVNGSDMANTNWEKFMRKPTTQKCCKIGERVARKRMTCVFDLHAVSKKNNIVHKAKLKLHGSEIYGKTFGKDIALHVAKCHRHKAVFEKCCSFRAQFIKVMDECRQLRGSARRSCRRQARQKYFP